jgi:hypothetical protein
MRRWRGREKDKEEEKMAEEVLTRIGRIAEKEEVEE